MFGWRGGGGWAALVLAQRARRRVRICRVYFSKGKERDEERGKKGRLAWVFGRGV